MTDTLDRVAALTDADRAEFWNTMSRSEKLAIASQMDTSLGSPFGEYRYDPRGFVHNVLGETTWSKMDAIFDSVLRYKITCVPAGHSVSKSHTAGRVVGWWNSVHAPGTALTITTATTFQQVKTILWPHIRKMVTRHGLPGRTNMTEWIIPSTDDPNYLSAYGFSASDNDEASVQGRHAPHFLIVVDEAGGISHELGKALWSLLTGGHTRMLLIGNPSTEEENTWFQKRCESGRANTNVIPISIYDTPNFTGEDAGSCHSCPEGTPTHLVATHLVDQQWEREVVDEFGADSPYVEARVHARFPSYIQDKVLPLTWLEMAQASQFPNEVLIPARISLGCDIASDGGDEFVIARRIGMRASVLHHAAGAANENAEDVADRIFEEIIKAEILHAQWGIKETVRVKIDSIGVGWGVVSNLQKRRERGEHHSDIVPVNVSREATDPVKYANLRAELWWNLRILIQPARKELTFAHDGVTAAGSIFEYTGPVRLEVDTRTLSQLSAPMYKPDSAGRITIEKKAQIKKRTNGRSPDRGEAILLAFLELASATTLDPFTPIGVPRNGASWSQVA